MFYYVVTCRFEGTDPTLSEKWLTWLIPGHIDDVLQAGAVSAEILRLDDEMPHFQINYRFDSREDFQRYERDHAPRLRAEGLSRFPLELGLKFRRWTGVPVAIMKKSSSGI